MMPLSISTYLKQYYLGISVIVWRLQHGKQGEVDTEWLGGELLAQPDLRLQRLGRGQGQRRDAADGPDVTHGGRQGRVA